MKSQPIWAIAALAAVGFAALPAHAQQGGRVRWSGNVDDTTIVYIHGTDVRTTTVKGKSASNVNADEQGRLPHRPMVVFLERQRGRGRIRVIQQPNPGNDFTAAVRLRDPQVGAAPYAFTLTWQPNGGY